MAQRIAGVAYLYVGGQQFPLRGNFTVSPSMFERTMLAGQDRVHGYQELPRVPWIEGDISTIPGLSIRVFEGHKDVTVSALLANGKQYNLSGAVCKSAIEINTRDGQMRIRWEGTACDEFDTPGAPTISATGITQGAFQA